MLKYIKSVWLFLLLTAIAFYGLPIWAAWYSSTGQSSGMEILLNFIALPTVCFILSILSGRKSGFNLIYPLIIGIIFMPSIFIFYNPTAWIFSIVYIVIALSGNAIGSALAKTI